MNAMTLTPENNSEISAAVNAGAVTLAKRMELVKHVISEMVEGVHYGASFPGDKKKNLLKPGADYLGVAFRLVPTFDVERIDLADGHREYSVNCRVNGPDGSLVTNGLGSCSTMESKYRWRNAKKKCPNCGLETVIKGKEQFGGGWLCWKTKGGCDSKWADGAPEIEQQVVGKVENTDPADQYNTCLKIAKKRAMVDAMITATGCSADFTQDAEDMGHEPEARAAAPASAQTPPPRPATPPVQAASAAQMVDVEVLASNLDQATDFLTFKAAWAAVVEVQTKLSSPDMARMIKLKRNGEIKWGAL